VRSDPAGRILVVMRLLALVCIAACGFPGAGASDGSDDSQGDDAVEPDAALDAADDDDSTPFDAAEQDAAVDAFIPDAFVPDAPPSDRDGDGVLDTADNCPDTENPTQWNEDADTQGDLCDPCPHIVGPHTDGDGDGIGDACDPRPTMAGDQLALFEGFNTDSAGAPAGWTNNGDNRWSVSGGQLRYTTTSDAEAILHIAPTGGLGTAHVVHTAGSFVSETSGNAQVIAALTDYVTTGGGRFMHCAVSHDRQVLELFRFSGAANPDWVRIGQTMLAVTDNEQYRIVSRSQGNMHTCRTDTLLVEGTVTSNGGTRIGLRVRNATTRVNYVAVYRAP
jgi:hypothetical protein